ncbi:MULTISPECIES: branched-chain amino acid ABC transporter substrate-binding protein [Caldimonas]|uniref:branched-chain amino acid ABC transporter substrate-binding protein n=1 Tax=Caldimonas TaxID=196013 RepID=UPI0003AA1C43|nr:MULTISPECIES: branched-chain amino acid ABC transporter substrate-binding protein [Caldimonas]MCX7659348.1 branched-chain amino acid ABC transporter substrate-binding protein [Caldimonas manganoxidans]GIX25368.1 MAG: branched chain amino acid ABC transporter substrate-binding protein [Caldimonas sp.]
MKKLTLLATAVALAGLAACGKKEEAPAAAAPAAAPVSEEVVRLGHVGPTSGAIAHLGKDNELGARLAIDELNAQGLVIGGKKIKFELLAEDDAADPKQGTAAAQKLVDSGVKGVIGHLNSGTTIPASKIYSDAGIPQISPSATNPRYTRQGFKTTFRVVADDVHLGGTLGRYAVNTLKGKSIAVIDDRTAYGQGVADEFEKGVKEAGGNVVAREFTHDKATDFTAILTTIKGKNPDIVFYGGMDAVAGPMLRQMKSLGINAKFMGGDGICTGELPKLAAGSMADEQVYCAEAGGVEGEQKAGLDAFKEKFKQKFGVDVQIYAPYVYDATMVMVEAMKKADSTDPAKYLPELAKIEYKGVTGTITFDEKGDIKNGALTLYTYKGGQREQLAVIR